MAFKEKTDFIGLLSQKLGEKVVIEGKYAISSGTNNSKINFYEKGDDNNWILLNTTVLAYGFGSSLCLHDGICFASLTSGYQPFVLALSHVVNFAGVATIFYPTNFSFLEGFGSSVSVFGNNLAIGAPLSDSNAGKVYIYTKKDDEEWTDIYYRSESYVIQPNDSTSNMFFGSSVSMDGDFLIVGSKGDNGNKGSVYVFGLNEDTYIFEQTQKIIASDGQLGDQFGGQVSLSNEYFAVGAEFADLSDQEVNVGAVYIYTYSDIWNELKKITSVNESGLIANNFGHSICLNGEYLIVGSPNAGNKGVADVFYRKRNWGHLKKITSDSISTGDNFGESVGIDYPNLIVGASKYETISSDDRGRIYLFEDPEVRLRLTQEFDVEDTYLPTKASVYLKRSGSNSGSSWSLQSSRSTIIDASNFSSINQSNNKIIFDDRISGFTGNGYMAMSPEDDIEIIGGGDSSFSVVNYPIQNSVPSLYNIWIRCRLNSFNPSGIAEPSGSLSLFSVDLILDGIVIKEMTSSVENDEWFWMNTTLVLPDIQQHILGIRMKEKGALIDKIYVDANSDIVPYGEGPPYSISPYVTTHMKVYRGLGLNFPVTPVYAYDYKTTLDEIIQDDWYNFNITIVGEEYLTVGRVTITSIIGLMIPFGDRSLYIDGNFFLVMSSSGASADNFVLWEVVDADEYFSGNVGLRLTEIGTVNNTEQKILTKKLYYQAKTGDADINTDTWYLDNTKQHAFKIYSSIDPIRNA